MVEKANPENNLPESLECDVKNSPDLEHQFKLGVASIIPHDKGKD